MYLLRVLETRSSNQVVNMGVLPLRPWEDDFFASSQLLVVVVSLAFPGFQGIIPVSAFVITCHYPTVSVCFPIRTQIILEQDLPLSIITSTYLDYLCKRPYFQKGTGS